MSNYTEGVIHIQKENEKHSISDLITSARFRKAPDAPERQWWLLEGVSVDSYWFLGNWISPDTLAKWFEQLPWDERSAAIMSASCDYYGRVVVVSRGKGHHDAH